MDWYFGLISSLEAKRLVWMESTPVRGDAGFGQNNEILSAFNLHVGKLQQKYNFSTISFWKMLDNDYARETLFTDNVHLQAFDNIFFRELGDMILGILLFTIR